MKAAAAPLPQPGFFGFLKCFGCGGGSSSGGGGGRGGLSINGNTRLSEWTRSHNGDGTAEWIKTNANPKKLIRQATKGVRG